MVKYTVKAGDTLSKIAIRHNTTVDAIMAENTFIKNKNVIQVGWVLNIREKQATAPTPETPTLQYKKIGKKVEECLSEIEKLPVFKELEALLNGNSN